MAHTDEQPCQALKDELSGLNELAEMSQIKQVTIYFKNQKCN